MAELVDAYVSGAYIERCAGSTPVRGTLNIETLIDYQSVRVFLLSFWRDFGVIIRDRKKCTPKLACLGVRLQFNFLWRKSAAKITLSQILAIIIHSFLSWAPLDWLTKAAARKLI